MSGDPPSAAAMGGAAADAPPATADGDPNAPAAAGDDRGGGRKVQFSGDVREMDPGTRPLYEPQFTSTDVRNIGTRLYSEGMRHREERQKELDIKKEQLQKEEVQEYSFRPEVCPSEFKYEDFNQFLKQQAKWQVDQRNKLNKKIKEREEQRPEFQDLKPDKRAKPNEKSQTIIEKKIQRGQYEGPVKGWKQRFHRFNKKRSGMLAGTPDPATGWTGTPTINRYPPELDAGRGPAHERLHRNAHEREESLQLLRAWEEEKDRIDPETGRPRFQPKVLASPMAALYYENARLRAAGSDGAPVSPQSRQSAVSMPSTGGFTNRRSFPELYHHLSSDRPSTRQQRAPTPHRTVSIEPECTFTPQTNPTSSLIVERSGRRPPLYQPPQQQPAEPSEPPQQRLLQQRRPHPTSVRPGRHGYSDDADGNSNDANNNFLARQCRDVLDKQRRVQQLREEIKAKELQGCTFQPSLSQRSHELFEQSSYKKLGRVPNGERDERRWSPSRGADAEYEPYDAHITPSANTRMPEHPSTAPNADVWRHHIDPDIEPSPARDQMMHAMLQEERQMSPPRPVVPRSTPRVSPPPPPRQYVDPVSAAAIGGVLTPGSGTAPRSASGDVAVRESPFLTNLHSELQAVIDEWRQL